jgi:prepilin-type processing-associated H-X9-DG protein
VVIGIIAILIAVLMPALGRARMAANSVACQSNLRQIGAIIQVYGAQNKGIAPFGRVSQENRLGGHLGWSWVDTLSIMMGTARNADPRRANQVIQANKVFYDADTIPNPSPFQEYGSHYTGHIRFFAAEGELDGIAYPDTVPLRPHKLAIRESPRVMIVWDGAQNVFPGAEGSATDLSWGLDDWKFKYEHYCVYPNPRPDLFPNVNYSRPILLGDRSVWGQATATGQVRFNFDPAVAGDAWKGPYMRFRHFKNTSANFLFADGHVDARKVGEVTVRDISMSK